METFLGLLLVSNKYFYTSPIDIQKFRHGLSQTNGVGQEYTDNVSHLLEPESAERGDY